MLGVFCTITKDLHMCVWCGLVFVFYFIPRGQQAFPRENSCDEKGPCHVAETNNATCQPRVEGTQCRAARCKQVDQFADIVAIWESIQSKKNTPLQRSRV
eukprot:TRINITY_DN14891_c0_g1_i1.p2 TRINITY_DN14891_c0_g1~~TRINITY_DN14891_c0_g1_i1.p2  ORF type:complete len:100 (+),score=5.90 TRINITY_DN14891_c0_g1_i1:131-430(+)